MRVAPALQRVTLLAAFAVSTLLPVVVPDAAAQTLDPPNVIVLVADDLGYGDLGSYGSPDARTPNLDALAARGLRLTDYYAGGPVCTPSRYALLTGRHTFRAGDPSLLTALEWNNTRSGIGSELVTLPEALSEEGYETALIGKWHLGQGRTLTSNTGNTEFHPTRHGFDTFFGLFGGAIDYNTHWNASLYLDWWEGQQRRPEDSLLYATHVFGDRAVAFLDTHAGAGTTAPPFFLYLPVTASHLGRPIIQSGATQQQLPIGEEREYLSRFDDLYPDDDHPRKRNLAMTAVLDDEVGRIVAALERNDLLKNTLIWFVSDNGALPGYGSNGPLRGGKNRPYEGGIRVPSFVVWEGHVAPGTSAQVAGNVDVLPTVLALAGAAPPASGDGLDLSGHLLGEPPVARGIAVPNTVHGDAVRQGRWKYVRRYRSNGRPYQPELYDLSVDLGEETNVASVYPDTVALLASLLPYGTQPRVEAGCSPPALTRPVAGPPVSLRVVPNPTSGATAVMLSLAAGGTARVEVFDGLGRRVALLHDGVLGAGEHTLRLNGSALPGGVYVVRAVTDEGETAAVPITLLE